MGKWVDMMKRLGGGEVPKNNFHDELFSRWEQQVIGVEDYAYGCMDFKGDPDLVLPPDAEWGAIGKKKLRILNFFRF